MEGLGRLWNPAVLGMSRRCWPSTLSSSGDIAQPVSARMGLGWGLLPPRLQGETGLLSGPLDQAEGSVLRTVTDVTRGDSASIGGHPGPLGSSVAAGGSAVS